MDWANWHNRYETTKPLQERLELVCDHISSAIQSCSEELVTILSVCAGDGRDLISALASLDIDQQVCANLIESNADLVSKGRALAAQSALMDSITFHCADATKRQTYIDLIPADIVIVSGVFGNLKELDVARLIMSLRSFCKSNALVVWTRNLTEFDDGELATQRILMYFRDSGFEGTKLDRTASNVFAIGTHEFRANTEPLPRGESLFEFSGFWRLGSSS